MAIPRKTLNPDLISAILPFGTYDDWVCAVIVATLLRFRGNRTHTARALKISLRTLRHKIRIVESFGYAVPASEGPLKKRDAGDFVGR
jgi:hypothetical protein